MAGGGGSILGHAFQINRLQFRPSLVSYPFFLTKSPSFYKLVQRKRQKQTERERERERERQKDRFTNAFHVHLKYFISVWLILIFKKKSIRKNSVWIYSSVISFAAVHLKLQAVCGIARNISENTCTANMDFPPTSVSKHRFANKLKH